MSNKITKPYHNFVVKLIYDREHGVHSRSRPHVQEIEIDDEHLILRDQQGNDLEITPIEEVEEYTVKIMDNTPEPEN